MNRKNEHIGNLNRRVTIYEPTYVRNELGAATPRWSTLATVWAEVLPVSGNEVQDADRTTAVKKMRFRVRTQSSAGVKEQMVIRYQSEDYDITEIHDDPKSMNDTFRLITAERRRENLTA